MDTVLKLLVTFLPLGLQVKYKVFKVGPLLNPTQIPSFAELSQPLYAKGILIFFRLRGIGRF